jgi:hypothetical protein
VGYCQMLEFLHSVETYLSSSSSDSSSSESVRASPPLIPDLFISPELWDILEMLEVEATQGTVPVEKRLAQSPPLVSFCVFVCFICDNTINIYLGQGLMAAMAHEVGRNPRQSPDRVRICRDYNRIKNLPYL